MLSSRPGFSSPAVSGLPSYGGTGYGSSKRKKTIGRLGGDTTLIAVVIIALLAVAGLGWGLISSRSQLAAVTRHRNVLDSEVQQLRNEVSGVRRQLSNAIALQASAEHQLVAAQTELKDYKHQLHEQELALHNHKIAVEGLKKEKDATHEQLTTKEAELTLELRRAKEDLAAKTKQAEDSLVQLQASQAKEASWQRLADKWADFERQAHEENRRLREQLQDAHIKAQAPPTSPAPATRLPTDSTLPPDPTPISSPLPSPVATSTGAAQASPAAGVKSPAQAPAGSSPAGPTQAVGGQQPSPAASPVAGSQAPASPVPVPSSPVQAAGGEADNTVPRHPTQFDHEQYDHYWGNEHRDFYADYPGWVPDVVDGNAPAAGAPLDQHQPPAHHPPADVPPPADGAAAEDKGWHIWGHKDQKGGELRREATAHAASQQPKSTGWFRKHPPPASPPPRQMNDQQEDGIQNDLAWKLGMGGQHA